MFYSYVRYLPPGDAMKMFYFETVVLVVAYTFMHMFVFEELADYLYRTLAYNFWFETANAVRWVEGVLTSDDGYGLGASFKQACIVWLITTPILLMFRRLQNIIATS